MFLKQLTTFVCFFFFSFKLLNLMNINNCLASSGMKLGWIFFFLYAGQVNILSLEKHAVHYFSDYSHCDKVYTSVSGFSFLEKVSLSVFENLIVSNYEVKYLLKQI